MKEFFKNKIVLIFLAVMVVLFFFITMISLSGWGYAGYGGWHHGPSFMYFGGAHYYSPGPSVRHGSTSGPRGRGGGIGSGK
ncbi:MAG: hypothetical protein ABEH43_03520 [Flavobacteriales bacterium]